MSRRLMNRKKIFTLNDKRDYSDILEFIESSLKLLKIDKKCVMRTVLIAEEVLCQMPRDPNSHNDVRVRIKKIMGDAEVSLSFAGSEFDPYAGGTSDTGISDLDDEEAQLAIRSILLKSQGEKLKFSYKNGMNKVRIIAGQMERSMLTMTIAALILGVIAGLILRFAVSSEISNAVSEYALTPFKTMFLNALKMVIAPVVFFSIASCISQFKNLSELGRIGAKVMGMYFLTTVIAVLLSIGIFQAVRPGSEGSLTDNTQTASDTEASEYQISSDSSFSLLDTIIGIVPDNVVKPFLNSDTLQIIFLAMICGAAVGMLGEYSSTLRGLFEALNSLFLTITTIISRFIPLAVFCSVVLLVLKTGWDTLFSVMGMAGTYLLCILAMLIVYGLLILILGRLNPLTFYKKNREGMLTSLTLASSTASMPTNMRTCTEKLGISPKVCNFSIPLGATINMDGTSIVLTIAGLFMARVHGIEISGAMLVSLLVTVVLLSLGAPGVPGSGIVCLGVILGSLGVPLESLGMLIGIYPFFDMIDTMSNTTGDVAAALIVAKSEELLDKKVYSS